MTVNRTRPRGRPKRSLSDQEDAQTIFAESELMLDDLRTHKSDYRRIRGEPEDVWIDRLEHGIRRAWAASSRSHRYDSKPPVSDDPSDYWDSGIVVTEIPIPDAVVRRCVREAIELLEEGRPILDHIAYTLVGYGWRLEPNSIRSLVQEVRKGNV